MTNTERFDTREFVNSHWTTPRGRGGWLFRNADTGEVVNFNGTFTEAKKLARAHSPRSGWVVLP